MTFHSPLFKKLSTLHAYNPKELFVCKKHNATSHP